MKTDGLKEPILGGDQFQEKNATSRSMASFASYEKQELQLYQSHYACEFGCRLRKIDPEEIAKTQKARKQLFLASGFCVLFMIAEIIGGFIANSLALLSDATHLLSDFAGLMISITALWLVQKEAGQRYSFGYHRAEIIGALFSIILIWGLTVWLVFEAIRRLIERPAVDGKVMFIVACLGILVNIIMGVILFQGGHHSHGLGGGGHSHEDNSHDHKHSHGGGHSHGAHKHEHSHKRDSKHDHSHKHDSKHDHSHKHDSKHDHSHKHDHGHKHDSESKKGDQRNINVRSAFVHVLGDLVQSVGVVVAAAFIWADHQLRILDPICTLIFSVIVVFTTTTLVRDAIDVLMENVPRHVNLEKLVEDLAQLPDVADVHDLHVWNLSVGKPALSVHLLAKATTFDTDGKIIPACADGILRKAQKLCSREYHIYHSTIQIEYPRDHHMKVSEIGCPSYCGDGHHKDSPNDLEKGQKKEKKENKDKEDQLELSEKSS